MAKQYFWDENSKKVAQDAIKKINNTPYISSTRPPTNPDSPTLDTNASPQVYVVKTPSAGIPALVISGGGDPQVTRIDCQVYQVDNIDGFLVTVPTFTVPIYNLSTSDITGDIWCIVTKDAYGNWYIVAPASSGALTEKYLGDVIGPPHARSGQLAVFDGPTGRFIKARDFPVREYGQAFLTTPFDLSTNPIGSPVTIGLSTVLPRGGTYDLFGFAQGFLNITTLDSTNRFAVLQFDIFDTTIGTIATLMSNIASAVVVLTSNFGSSCIKSRYRIFDGPRTLNMRAQVYASGTTAVGTAFINSFPNAVSGILWERLGDF